MNLPDKNDFINIHDHGAVPMPGFFTVDNIMVHEGREPQRSEGIAYTVGAHPWHIDEDNIDRLFFKVKDFSKHHNVIAIGEAGFDKLKGASLDLQRESFQDHARLADSTGKPLFIHCVRAWDELLKEHKQMKPVVPWIIHGFRGKPDLAAQLLEKGFYLSPWVEWAIRPESSDTIKSIPLSRLFLETDGFDISIEPVYQVVASHLEIKIGELKAAFYSNFIHLFARNG